MFSSIRWRITISYVGLIVLIIAGLTFYASTVVRREYQENLRTQLAASARRMAQAAQPLLAAPADTAILDTNAKEWGNLLQARVTIIRADGLVLGDSAEDGAHMDNHLGRPEVQQALLGGLGVSTRYSQTMGYEMMYVAVPIPENGPVVGVARLALPLTQVESAVDHLRRQLLIASLFIILPAIAIAVFIAERTARPVRQLTQVAQRIAEGDLNARILLRKKDEVGQLARALDHMADQLRTQVTNLAEERGRLAAILERMADGVVMTDENGTVQMVNPAAARLLDVSQATATQLTFAQLVRNHRLIDVWQRCQLLDTEQVETIEDQRGLFLQAVITPFHEAQVRNYLIVLQDLTQIRRLETVRRDFISNLSHEIRTPLAAMKALVETLRGGALDERTTAEHFLQRLEGEVDLLTQMVQELLDLSRIESGRAPLLLRPVQLSEVILPVVERLQPQAERAGLILQLDLPDQPLTVLADMERVRQVVTNLVHNAIKFTPSGGSVTISAATDRDEVVIAVRDTGVGIPANDLPRIFERFYKADRARSGGGTGLGLAIARHVVQAHGGRIWAESTEGKGSTFFFSLPSAGQSRQ